MSGERLIRVNANRIILGEDGLLMERTIDRLFKLRQFPFVHAKRKIRHGVLYFLPRLDRDALLKADVLDEIGAPLVVVVDDDPAVCNSLKFSLELEGFIVHTYGSGTELLRAADIDAFDCFVIDQRMPEMTGLELIGKLRDRHISTPAILIISQPSVGLSVRAAKANVPIVEKPFLCNALVDRIRDACGQG